MAFAGSRDSARDDHAPTATDRSHTTRAAGTPNAADARGSATGAASSPPRGRAFARRVELDVDWARASTFGSGLAIGALLGASVALLLAPASGPVTRNRIGRARRRAGARATDAWADLGEELRHATFRTRRKVRQRVNAKLGRDDSLLGSLRRRRETRADDAPVERTRRRAPWSRGERDTVAVEL